MTETIYILEASPLDPSGVAKTVNFSSGLPEESFPGRAAPYPVRLKQALIHETSVFENNVPGSTSISVGASVINNTDGRFDDLLDYSWDTRSVEIKRGKRGDPYANFVTEFRGTALEIVADQNDLIISLRDNSFKIAKPLQSVKYAGSGGKEGGADLRGRPKPLLFGPTRNASPVPVDSVALTMQIHEPFTGGAMSSIDGVYDAGNKITFHADYPSYSALTSADIPPGKYGTCLTEGFIRLGAPPAGQITVDAVGAFYTSGLRSLSDLAYNMLVSKMGLVAGDLDVASFTQLKTDVPGEYEGVYFPEPDFQADEFLETIVSAQNGFWHVTRAGLFKVQQFKFRAPSVTIRQEDLKSLARVSSPQPLHRVRVNYAKNPTIQNVGDFVLPKQTLTGYIDDPVYDVHTDVAGNGGNYTGKPVFKVFLNDTEVNDLESVKFSVVSNSPWITIDSLGVITVTNPGGSVGNTDAILRANLGEFNIEEKFTLTKSGPSFRFLSTAVSGERFIRFDDNNNPVTTPQTKTLTVTGQNNSTMIASAVDNLGQQVPLTSAGTGVWSFGVSNVSKSLLASYVDFTVTSPEGSVDRVRFPILRGENGYIAGILNGIAAADSQIDIYYDSLPPVGKIDDLWFDTDDGNKLYRHDGTGWVLSADTRIADALLIAMQADDKADGKIKTFLQEVAPVSDLSYTLAVGDLWYKPSTKMLYRWSGSNWNSAVGNLVEKGSDIGVSDGATTDIRLRAWGDTSRIRITGNNVQELISSHQGEQGAVSTEGMKGGIMVSAFPGSTAEGFCYGWIGLSETPNPTSAADMKFGIFNYHDTFLYIIINGVNSGLIYNAPPNRTNLQGLSVVYDEVNVYLKLDAAVLYTLTADLHGVVPGKTYYAMTRMQQGAFKSIKMLPHKSANHDSIANPPAPTGGNILRLERFKSGTAWAAGGNYEEFPDIPGTYRFSVSGSYNADLSIANKAGWKGNVVPTMRGQWPVGGEVWSYANQVVFRASKRDGFDPKKSYRLRTVWRASAMNTFHSRPAPAISGTDDGYLVNTFAGRSVPNDSKPYMLVSIVHGADYTGGDTGLSGLYSETGVKQWGVTDCKVSGDPTNLGFFTMGQSGANAGGWYELSDLIVEELSNAVPMEQLFATSNPIIKQPTAPAAPNPWENPTWIDTSEPNYEKALTFGNSSWSEFATRGAKYGRDVRASIGVVSEDMGLNDNVGLYGSQGQLFLARNGGNTNIDMVNLSDAGIAALAYKNQAAFYADVSGAPVAQMLNTSDAVALGFNPTFNDWADAAPAPVGWTVNYGSLSRDTSKAQVGRYAVKAVCSGTANTYMSKRVDFGAMPVGTFVSGSVDMFIESRTAGTPALIVDLYDTADNYHRTIVNANPAIIGARQRVPFTARAAAGVQIKAIHVYVIPEWSGHPNGIFAGTVYYDNFDFYFEDSTTDNQQQRFDQVVPGYGRPSDYATADLRLTSIGSIAANITGNSFANPTGTGGYECCVRGDPLHFPLAEADIHPSNWTMISLDTDSAGADYTLMGGLMIHVHRTYLGGVIDCYRGSSHLLRLQGLSALASAVGKVQLGHDGNRFRIFVAGIEYGDTSPALAFNYSGPFWPKWHAYEAYTSHSGLVCRAYTDRKYDVTKFGPNAPANNATVGAEWGTNLNGRPTELIDGRIATALNAGGQFQSRMLDGAYFGTSGTETALNLKNRASRLNATSGQASSNFIASDGRSMIRIGAIGNVRDGNVVSFPSALPDVPKMIWGPGGIAPPQDRNISVYAENLSVSGFTMRARYQTVTPTTTYTDNTVSQPGDGGPTYQIDRSNGSTPYDGRFVFRFNVTVGNIAPGEPGTVTVNLYMRKSGVWTVVGTYEYQSSASLIDVSVFSDCDFGAGAEFGLSVAGAEGAGSTANLVSVTYTAGSTVNVSLNPAGSSDFSYQAVLQ